MTSSLNDLCVAVRLQTVAARFQLGPTLDMVEQLTVEDDEDVAVFVRHRLLSVRQVNDAQPPHPQGQQA